MLPPLSRVGAITLFVEDVGTSRTFYAEVFDRPVVYEDESSVVFRFDNTLVNLLAVPAAHELVDPGVVGGADAGLRFQLTVWVDDTDAVCAELEARGVALLNGPMDRAWGQRTASFIDPSGHLWEIAQEIAATA
jgi:catechol 2,3-dioxygenase-like lactoylglutathione lyase family enzyme